MKKLIKYGLTAFMLLVTLTSSFFLSPQQARAAETKSIIQWRMLYVSLWPSTSGNGTWNYTNLGKTYNFKPSYESSYTVTNFREPISMPDEFRYNLSKYANIRCEKYSNVPNLSSYTDKNCETFGHAYDLYYNWNNYMYMSGQGGNAYYSNQWISNKTNEYICDKIFLRLNFPYAEKTNNGGCKFYVPFAIKWTADIVESKDVAVASITPTLFDGNSKATAAVMVKNNDTAAITTPVNFAIAGVSNQNQGVTLNGGQSKTIYFDFTAPASGSFSMVAEANKDRGFAEKNYTNNKLSVTGKIREENDLAVTGIKETSYLAKQSVAAQVTVKNNSAKSFTTAIDFSIPNVTSQTKNVTVPANSSKVVSFIFTTPGPGKITMTAEANKGRTITEKDYSNNKKSVAATITAVSNNDSKNCSDTIRWTETAGHRVTTGDGEGYTCTHYFTYETKLSASVSVSPTTLKSGYGFGITVNNSISTRLVSNNGGCSSWGSGRAASKTPLPPSRAEVRLPWTVKNTLGTQASTVALARTSNSVTASKFAAAASPVSQIAAKKIYTPVTLAGTKEAPKSHAFTIFVSGGGVNGVEFCKTLNSSITINGDMYSDDITGAN